MIITIDGPAGAGKSTLARQLAARLGFQFLDTGAMYRALTLAVVRAGARPDDGDAVQRLAGSLRLEWKPPRMWLQGTDVTDHLRDPQVTRIVGQVADHPGVRQQMVRVQREFAAGRDTVSEGRDQGSVVFPHAELKIYLTASPQERARRRVAQLGEQGIQASWEDVLQEQQQRDRRDQARPVGRLHVPEGAVEVVTDGLNPDQVLMRLESLVRDRRRE